MSLSLQEPDLGSSCGVIRWAAARAGYAHMIDMIAENPLTRFGSWTVGHGCRAKLKLPARLLCANLATAPSASAAAAWRLPVTAATWPSSACTKPRHGAAKPWSSGFRVQHDQPADRSPSTRRPHDPWRVVAGFASGTQDPCKLQSNPRRTLQPTLRSLLGAPTNGSAEARDTQVRLVMHVMPHRRTQIVLLAIGSYQDVRLKLHNYGPLGLQAILYIVWANGCGVAACMHRTLALGAKNLIDE